MKSATILKWLTLQALLALSVSPAFAGTKTAMPLTADAVNNSASQETVNAKASPAAILRAQILLDRAHFSPGEIDGAFGSNMQMAISAYQRNRKLEVTGIVDEKTWASLNQDDLPALSTYTIDAADVAGPFLKIPASIEEQARLKSLAYVSPVEALSEKFHANPRLLILLNVGKNFDKAGEEILVPNVLAPEPLPAAAKVVVDRSDASVSLLDSAGNVIARYPASTGSKHDPLPVGEWLIKGVALNPVFHYNPELFWDADPKSEKAKIAAGPNNPVGTAWIDLSKEHYGIHGTPEPSKIGKTESHGCIRLSNWNVTELAAAISPDMPALLQE